MHCVAFHTWLVKKLPLSPLHAVVMKGKTRRQHEGFKIVNKHLTVRMSSNRGDERTHSHRQTKRQTDGGGQGV